MLYKRMVVEPEYASTFPSPSGYSSLMKVLKIDVGKAEVALHSLADVVIGDDLVITGTSNREGHTIIVNVKGVVDLGTKFATVEDGKFEATFSTSAALTGDYTAEADDGEGHTDTTTVRIITPVRTEASPAPSSTPASATSQQVPEPIPTAQPENTSESASTSSQPTVPGFETVIAIAMLLTVYLLVFVVRKRRN